MPWRWRRCVPSGLRRWGSIIAPALLLAACGGSSPTEPGVPPPVDPVALVAVMGCSQTTAAWDGWESLGGTGPGGSRVWSKVVGYGGGSIANWDRDIPDGEYWQRLDTNIAANPPANIVWWEICDLARRNGTTDRAEAVVAEISNHVPGATIFVSPLADFERPETCLKQDIANSKFLVDHLVASGLAERGPDLPRVLDVWIQPPQGDGVCHVGSDGQLEFGRALAGFDWNIGLRSGRRQSAVATSSAPITSAAEEPPVERREVPRSEAPFKRP